MRILIMEQLYVPGVLRRHAARLIDQVIALYPLGLSMHQIMHLLG